MLNISFTGNIYNSSGVLVNPSSVKYKAYFHKVNSSSSSSIWNDVRVDELGQFNFNLGDSDILTQDGYASSGDKVVILFWTPITSNHTDLDLIEYCYIEQTLTSDSVYIQDVQLQPHNNPTCSFVLTGNTVNSPISITNTSTNDNYSWEFSSKTHYHRNTLYNQVIFPLNNLPLDTLDIDWGDGTELLNQPLSNSPFLHVYDTSGNFDVSCIVENTRDRFFCQQLFTPSIIYKVQNGLTWVEPVLIGQNVQFLPEITGHLSQIEGVDYYIDGTLEFSGLVYDESFIYRFTTAGNHVVRQCIHYSDGFIDQEQCSDFDVEMTSVASFGDMDHECGKMFYDLSTVGAPPVTKYQWDVYDGLVVLAHVEGEDEYKEWYYAWPYTGTFLVRLAVTDSNNNTVSVTKEYIINECNLSDGGNSGSGGMGGSVVTHTEYIDRPLPKINVVEFNEEENDIIVDVIDVIDVDML